MPPRQTTQEDIDNRFSYHTPKPGQAEKYIAIRNTAKSLANTINELAPDSREKSLAFTQLENTVMWANAAIARHGD